MESPVLLLGSPRSLDEISQYNYCQLGSGEYYYIDEWISTRNSLWEAHCERDLLATYRSEIMATTAFVEYDTEANPGIIDHRISTLETATYAAYASAFTPVYNAAGSYILSVSGRNGSVSTFALSLGSLNNLLNNVSQWAGTVLENVETVEQAVKALARKLITVGSAAENIRSCTWVPWQVEGNSKQIYLGEYPTEQAGREVDGSTALETSVHTMQIPWQASDWRKCSMCHSFGIFLPFVGNVGIDATQLLGQSELNVSCSVDKRTGDVAYILWAGVQTIGSYSGNCGAQIPIGVSNVNPLKVGSSIMTTVASMTAGNALGAGAGIAQTAQNVLIPTVTCVGTLQSSAAAKMGHNMDITMWSEYKPTNVAPSSVSAAIGTPTMAVKTVGSVSGFVKTRGASVNAAAGASELRQINSLLDGGVFIE